MLFNYLTPRKTLEPLSTFIHENKISRIRWRRANEKRKKEKYDKISVNQCFKLKNLKGNFQLPKINVRGPPVLSKT